MSWFSNDNLVELYSDARFKIERMIAESEQDSVLIKTINSNFSRVEVKEKLSKEYALLKKFQLF
jgi:hypothetical protein